MPRLSAPEFAEDIPRPDVQVTHQRVGNVSQPEDRHVTRSVSRDQPFLLDGDFLQVYNDEPHTPITFAWGRKQYTILPGEDGFVPFEALVNDLGDPRSMDNEVQRFSDSNGNKGTIMTRHEEITRLFARYAVENENISELVEKGPTVRVLTLKGQPVKFPIQRPDMLPLPVVLVDEHAVNTDTTKMFGTLQAENDELRDKVQRLEELMQAEIERRAGVEPATT